MRSAFLVPAHEVSLPPRTVHVVRLRHGDYDLDSQDITFWSERGSLNAKGHSQMMRVAKRLKGRNVVGIRSSPFKRAVESRYVIGKQLGLRIPQKTVNQLAPNLLDEVWERIEADWRSRHGDREWVVSLFYEYYPQEMAFEAAANYVSAYEAARSLRDGEVLVDISHEIFISLATGVGHKQVPPPLEPGVDPVTQMLGKGDAIDFAFTFKGNSLAELCTEYLPLPPE